MPCLRYWKVIKAVRIQRGLRFPRLIICWGKRMKEKHLKLMKQCYLDIQGTLAEEGCVDVTQRYKTMQSLLEVFRDEDKKFYDEAIELMLKRGTGLHG